MVINILQKLNIPFLQPSDLKNETPKDIKLFDFSNSPVENTNTTDPKASKNKEICDMVLNWQSLEGGANKKEIKKLLRHIKNLSNSDLQSIMQTFFNCAFRSEKISEKDKAKFYEIMQSELTKRLDEAGAVPSSYKNRNLVNLSQMLVMLEKNNLKESIREDNKEKNLANIHKHNQHISNLLDNVARNSNLPKEKYVSSEWFNKYGFKKLRTDISDEEFIRRMSGNGVIDEESWQIIGNCWAHSGGKSMATSEVGLEILNSHIKKVEGGHLIYLGKAAKMGLPKDGTPGVYFISQEEVFKDGSIQSIGDGDFTAMLLAMKKYMEESGEYTENTVESMGQSDIRKVLVDNITDALNEAKSIDLASDPEQILKSLTDIKNTLIQAKGTRADDTQLGQMLKKLIEETEACLQANLSGDTATLEKNIKNLAQNLDYAKDFWGPSNVMHADIPNKFYEILTGLENPEPVRLEEDSDIPIGISNKLIQNRGSLNRNVTLDDNMYAKLLKLHEEGRISCSIGIKTNMVPHTSHKGIDGPLSEDGRYATFEPGHAITIAKMTEDAVWLNESNFPDLYIKLPKEVFKYCLRDMIILRYY